MTRARFRFPMALMALVAVLVAGCSKREDPPSRAMSTVAPVDRPAPEKDEGGAVVDPPLLAFLSQARALHHEANLHEAAGVPARAIDALERLTRAPKPHAETTVPEVEEVLSDTYARLAELRMRMGNFDGAARDVQEGLNHAKEPTYFRGHLFEVSGIIEEARASALADAGHPGDAKRARERALLLLHQAVEIQNKVITNGSPPAEGPR